MHRSQRPGRKRVARISREIGLAIGRMRGKPIVHFLHIGKTGGSAIKHAFQRYPAKGRFKVYPHKHGVRLRDVPEGERFMFAVRDPIGRFVSGFYSRQRQGQPRRFSPWSPAEKAAFERFSTPGQLAVALSSPDAEESEAARAAMTGIAHVRSSYWLWFEDEAYFRSRLSDLFFIAFQGRLTEDFELLKSRLGMPNDARLPSDPVVAHRNPKDVDKRLSAQALENLKAWYERDFEFVVLCREVVQARPQIREA